MLATLFNLRWLLRHRSLSISPSPTTTTSNIALPALLARRWLGLPFVLDFEDGLYLVRHYQSATYRRIERAVYRSCAAVIVVNPGLEERMRACGVAKPTVVIHGYFNGADVASDPRSRRERNARSCLPATTRAASASTNCNATSRIARRAGRSISAGAAGRPKPRPSARSVRRQRTRQLPRLCA